MKCFKNALTYVEGKGIIRTDVLFGEKIEKIGICNFADEVISLPENAVVLPGFIDEHIHGAGGADAMDGTQSALETIAATVAKEGVMEKGIGSEILVAILAAMPAHKRGDKLMRMFKMISHLPRQLYLDFLMRFTAIPVVVVPSGLKDMLRLDRLASLSLPADIITPFRERVIYPVIAYTFADVFKAESGEEGLSDLLKYAEKNSVIKAFPHYKLITDYQAMVDKCNRGDTEGAFKLAMAIPTEGELRLNIGEYVRSYNYDPDSQEPETACAYQLVVDYLCKGKFSFGRLYSRYQSYYEENLDDDNIVVKTLIPEDCRAAALAIELIINCASDILGLSSELEKLVLDPSSGLKRAISDFIATLGIAAGPLLKKYTKDSSPEIEELCSELIAERNASISSARDAVDLILRRKN